MAKAAAVVFQQRFDQALRLNLHYHGLWIDGSLACSFGGADFHTAAVITDADVERLVRAIRTRVLRFLRRTGKLSEEYTVEQDDFEASAHHLLGAAAVQGRIAFGPRAGAPALWEFYHLRSAWDPGSGIDPGDLPVPKHREDGSIDVTDDTAIVFVLLPGGTYTMGAQKADPRQANYDPQANTNERVHEETVAPFFMARHEMTQGQWTTAKADPSKL